MPRTMSGCVRLLPWKYNVLRIRYRPFRGGSTTPMSCQNGGRYAAPLPPPVEGLPKKTTMMTVNSVPSGPIRLCRVAASSATAKQISANSGQSFQKLLPTSGYAPRIGPAIRSMTRATTTE
jgi:hypothetical protein